VRDRRRAAKLLPSRREWGSMAERSVRDRAKATHDASRELATADAKRREAAVRRFAELLAEEREQLEQANAADLEDYRALVEQGEGTQALLDRLSIQDAKLGAEIEGVEAVADQDDPIGDVVQATTLDDGLDLARVRVPIGVIACAYESRPDAGVQMCALAARSGNAIVLKGGSEAARSNRVVADLARRALADAGLPADGVVLLEDRAELQALLDLDELVDLLVPRGSPGFVRFVQDNTRIPVLGHADGLCHTYVDGAADLDQALPVCVDAKTDYPAACNATETFLVHEAVASEFVPRLAQALLDEGVEVHAGEAARRRAIELDLTPATGETWATEHGDMACGLRVVGSLDEAVDHVNAHGSGHTDAILTADEDAARRFLEAVDAAGVYWNASTRFADGYRYGLGAEVGISTGKTHARGPVGLEGLTTTKWLMKGQAHRAGDYRGEDRRSFQHEKADGGWAHDVIG